MKARYVHIQIPIQTEKTTVIKEVCADYYARSFPSAGRPAAAPMEQLTTGKRKKKKRSADYCDAKSTCIKKGVG